VQRGRNRAIDATPGHQKREHAISEIQRNTKNPPVQKIHDMTFVFSDGD
jgi:hypothetical protein